MAIIILSIIACTWLAIVARNGLSPYKKTDPDIKSARDDLAWVIGLVIAGGVAVVILVILIVVGFFTVGAEASLELVVAAGNKPGSGEKIEKLINGLTVLVIIILVICITALSIFCFHAIHKIRISQTYQNNFNAIKKYYYETIGAAITGLIPAVLLLGYFFIMIIFHIYEREKKKKAQRAAQQQQIVNEQNEAIRNEAAEEYVESNRR